MSLSPRIGWTEGGENRGIASTPTSVPASTSVTATAIDSSLSKPFNPSLMITPMDPSDPNTRLQPPGSGSSATSTATSTGRSRSRTRTRTLSRPSALLTEALAEEGGNRAAGVTGMHMRTRSASGGSGSGARTRNGCITTRQTASAGADDNDAGSQTSTRTQSHARSYSRSRLRSSASSQSLTEAALPDSSSATQLAVPRLGRRSLSDADLVSKSHSRSRSRGSRTSGGSGSGSGGGGRRTRQCTNDESTQPITPAASDASTPRALTPRSLAALHEPVPEALMHQPSPPPMSIEQATNARQRQQQQQSQRSRKRRRASATAIGAGTGTVATSDQNPAEQPPPTKRRSKRGGRGRRSGGGQSGTSITPPFRPQDASASNTAYAPIPPLPPPATALPSSTSLEQIVPATRPTLRKRRSSTRNSRRRSAAAQRAQQEAAAAAAAVDQDMTAATPPPLPIDGEDPAPLLEATYYASDTSTSTSNTAAAPPPPTAPTNGFSSRARGRRGRGAAYQQQQQQQKSQQATNSSDGITGPGTTTSRGGRGRGGRGRRSGGRGGSHTGTITPARLPSVRYGTPHNTNTYLLNNVGRVPPSPDVGGLFPSAAKFADQYGSMAGVRHQLLPPSGAFQFSHSPALSTISENGSTPIPTHTSSLVEVENGERREDGRMARGESMELVTIEEGLEEGTGGASDDRDDGMDESDDSWRADMQAAAQKLDATAGKPSAPWQAPDTASLLRPPEPAQQQQPSNANAPKRKRPRGGRRFAFSRKRKRTQQSRAAARQEKQAAAHANQPDQQQHAFQPPTANPIQPSLDQSNHGTVAITPAKPMQADHMKSENQMRDAPR